MNPKIKIVAGAALEIIAMLIGYKAGGIFADGLKEIDF